MSEPVFFGTLGARSLKLASSTDVQIDATTNSFKILTKEDTVNAFSINDASGDTYINVDTESELVNIGKPLVANSVITELLDASAGLDLKIYIPTGKARSLTITDPDTNTDYIVINTITNNVNVLGVNSGPTPSNIFEEIYIGDPANVGGYRIGKNVNNNFVIQHQGSANVWSTLQQLVPS